MADNKKIEVRYVREAWDRMWGYISAVPGEIGGLGYATQQDGFILVDKVFLLPQVRSSGGVDFADHEHQITLGDGTECDDAMQWALQKAVADDRVEDMKFSWHSHGNISVMWSQTDESAIEKYGQMLPWVVSAVLNRDGKMLTRIDLFNTIIGHVTQKDVISAPMPNADVAADIMSEVEALTAERTYPTRQGSSTGSGSPTTQTTNGSGSGGSGSQKQLPRGRSYKGPYSSIRAAINAGDGVGLIFDPSDDKSKYNPDLINELEKLGYVILEQSDGSIYAMSPEGVQTAS